MDNCIFCKIIKGEINSHKVFEDENCFIFLDINPVTLGHTLLIPKEHYKWMQETPDGILNHCFLQAKNLMNKMKDKLKADYIQLSVVGTDVPHFHIHLIPKMYNENTNLNFTDISKKDFEKVLEILK